MATTVKELIDELQTSQGFLICISFVEKKEDGTLNLQHRYMRQQYPTEDLKSAFDNYVTMIGTDLKKSGAELIQAAEVIANQKFPLHIEEATIRPAEEDTKPQGT